MKLIKITLLVAFLGVVYFTHADASPHDYDASWSKALKCSHVALGGAAVLVTNAVSTWRELFACVGYNVPQEDSNHVYRYLKIVYEFVKTLVTGKIHCIVLHVKENVRLLKPYADEFDNLKCLHPPY